MQLSKSDIALTVTMALYFGSLLLPGLVATGDPTQFGYHILAIGWSGLFAGVFSWYGYIFGIVGAIALQLRRKILALFCSIAGLLLGLQALYLQTTNAQINFGDSYSSWERGMGELSVGYYLWLFALSLLIVQCIAALFKASQQVQKVSGSGKL